jgi:hypothetical protein
MGHLDAGHSTMLMAVGPSKRIKSGMTAKEIGLFKPTTGTQ